MTANSIKDNTEGSLGCSIKVLKAKFRLNQEQRAVLIGTLLGDGSLNKRGRFHRLHVKHSRKQLPLVEYRHKLFANITSMPIRLFLQKVKNKTYKFCEFVTLTHPEFSKIYKLFYPDGKKSITDKLVSEITNPLCLANWFMDDGGAEYAGLALNTHSFSKQGVQLLSKTLNKHFDLATNLRKNKSKWIIYIPKRKVLKFKTLLGPYILPEFEYKLIPYSKRSQTP